jgi:hypothetical protein
MSKKIILDAIKNHYGFKSNTEYAIFLGIAPQTLSSWYSRNSFDYELIYARCVDIDANWLLTGSGPMLKSDYNVGRDINTVNGTGSVVTGSGNSVGSINSHKITVPENAKKIIDGKKVIIEISEFSEIQKDNESLKTRVKDLEALIQSKDKTIETMQLFIDSLNKK